MATRAEALDQRLPAMRAVMDLVNEIPIAVSIGRVGDGWGLRINLRNEPRGIELPTKIGNVPAEFHVTGEARALQRGTARKEAVTAAVRRAVRG